MTKTRTTVLVSQELLEQAHKANINISRFLEDSLRAYLDTGSSKPQPQEPVSLILSMIPSELMQQLQAHGLQLNDKLVNYIIKEGAFHVVFLLEALKEYKMPPPQI